MKYLPILRKTVQLAVITLFCALPFLAALDFAGISGSLFSLNFFGVPFADPASTLQISGQALGSGIMPLTEVLIGAGLSLVLALFMGRIFCGWLCPYGLLSELVYRHKKPWKYARRLKVGIFLAALLLAIIFGYPFITWLSMPGQLSVAPLAAREGWAVLLLLLAAPFLALLLDLVSGRRFFCSGLCPQSVLLGMASGRLPKLWPGLRISWNKNKCQCKGAPCEKACQFGLHPRKTPDRSQCSMCGDCIAVCAKKGKALGWDFRSDKKSLQGAGE